MVYNWIFLKKLKILANSRTSQYSQLHKCKDWLFLTSEQLTVQGDETAETNETDEALEKNEPYILANYRCPVTNNLFKLVWDLKILQFRN